MQTRDVNSKTILGNPMLCTQFLRDYSNVGILKYVRQEDIEDIPGRYHLFDGSEAVSDTVKRIRIRGLTEDAVHNKRLPSGELSIFLIALMEHKSYVDYDHVFQILKYIVGIWKNRKAEMENIHPGCTRNKGFRYPQVCPIVYYEGKENWTADQWLHERLQDAGMPKEYVPDFQCRVVRIHDYSTEELLAKGNEFSLIMLLNKVQKSEDFEAWRQIPGSRVNAILANTPEPVLDILADTMHSLCRKVHLTEKETAEYISKIKERNMGYLFENMEPMDIQAERANTRREYENAQRERRRADAEAKRANEAEQQIAILKKQLAALQADRKESSRLSNG